MAIDSRYRMSQERLDTLKEELHYLETTREKEVAELIKEARSFGDLSENSEYDEAKNEQGKLYSRIAELENILLHAVIVDETSMVDVPLMAALLAALRNGWTGFVSGAQAVAVFLVGAWNDVLEAAQRIQSNFTAFSCGALTLSAGIGIFDDHYPIRLSAEETAALEEAAKHLPGKNAVALFTPERKAVRDAKGSLLVQPEQGHRQIRRRDAGSGGIGVILHQFQRPAQTAARPFPLFRLLAEQRQVVPEAGNSAVCGRQKSVVKLLHSLKGGKGILVLPGSTIGVGAVQQGGGVGNAVGVPGVFE